MMDVRLDAHKSKITKVCREGPMSGLPRPPCTASSVAAVASRPDAPSSRHVGKIVDPLARDDGELEPDFSKVEPSEGEESQAAPDAAATPDEDDAQASRGAKVRERLLLRAEEARRDTERIEPEP